jgi:hypothetical protein
MTFFYDLNKRLADLAGKQDAKQLAESKKAESVAKSPLTQALNESEKWIQKAINPAHKGNLHKALHVAQGETIPKAKIAKATHSKNPKLRHMAQFAKNVAHEDAGGTPVTPKQKSFAKLAPPADKITFADKIAGAKKEVDEMLGDVAADAIKQAIRGKKVADEGNAFTGKLKSTPKGEKFKLGNKSFKDTSDIEEKKEPRSKGTAFDPEYMKQQQAKKDAESHSRYDVKDTGYSKRYTRKVEEPKDDDKDDSKSNQADKYASPKKKGRPVGKPKGPERTTKGAWKHKGERKSKADEDLDTDGVMMTRPTNCSSEAAGDKSAIKAAIELLKKNGYNVSKKEAVDEFLDTEVKVSGTQGTNKSSGSSGGAGVSGVTGGSATGGSSSATGGSSSASNTNDQTALTKSGAAAGKGNTVSEESEGTEEKAPKASKSGFQFGKGVYESLDRQFKQALTEGMNVSVNMNTGEDGEARKNITVSADGEDADKLAELLKMAGLGGQGHEGTCSGCGQSPCGCEAEVVDENSPDWPTNTEYTSTKQNMDPVSNDLNSNKSTGQTTIPVVASQLRRQVSMEENVELERSLFKTWKNYKG